MTSRGSPKRVGFSRERRRSRTLAGARNSADKMGADCPQRSGESRPTAPSRRFSPSCARPQRYEPSVSQTDVSRTLLQLGQTVTGRMRASKWLPHAGTGRSRRRKAGQRTLPPRRCPSLACALLIGAGTAPSDVPALVAVTGRDRRRRGCERALSLPGGAALSRVRLTRWEGCDELLE